MSNIIIIGYSTEGTTDKRFLEAIIKKTFDYVANECESLVEVYDPSYISIKNKKGFVPDLKILASKAFSIGINVLCVHTDADDINDNNAFEYKINPAFEQIQLINDLACKNLVAVVPIRMSESWMLADKNLLRDEFGTNLSDQDLGINREPESIADPKEIIINALRIAQNDLPKRRKKITISDIYQPIGQNISIHELEKLSSFRKFKDSVRSAFVKMNYLHQ